MGQFNKGGQFNRGGQSTMHKATCSDCGRGCEVPFRPNSGKPVYCNDCFRKDDDSGARSESRGGFGKKFSHRDSGRSGFGDRSRQMHGATCAHCGKRCEVPFKPTGDKPVYCSDCFGAGKSESAGSGSSDMLDKQFSQLNAKLDRILKALENIIPKNEPKAEKPEKAIKEKVVIEKPTKAIKEKAVIEKLGKAPRSAKPKKAAKKKK